MPGKMSLWMNIQRRKSWEPGTVVFHENPGRLYHLGEPMMCRWAPSRRNNQCGERLGSGSLLQELGRPSQGQLREGTLQLPNVGTGLNITFAHWSQESWTSLLFLTHVKHPATYDLGTYSSLCLESAAPGVLLACSLTLFRLCFKGDDFPGHPLKELSCHCVSLPCFTFLFFITSILIHRSNIYFDTFLRYSDFTRPQI